jgi:oligoendopeptidase F
MFAEFEFFIHQAIEQRQPLTPQFLSEHYRALNSAYFGPTVIIDPVAEVEWARIPHFYYNFYVYQYATGISAALALSDRVLQQGVSARDAYLQFLQGGSSAFPIDLLKLAGVDMRTPLPVASSIAHFRSLVAQLEELLHQS